jgi:hypothetical protein
LLHRHGADQAQDGTPATSVRRLISALGRSMGLVELIFGQ